jgi:hypothetical protein
MIRKLKLQMQFQDLTMNNFNDKIDRLNSFLNKKIRASVLAENGVNFELLKSFTKDLRFEKLISKLLKNPIYKQLHYAYLSGEDIDKKVEQIELYYSQLNYLVDNGIFECNETSVNDSDETQTNDKLQEIKIVNVSEFKRLYKNTLKEFAFIILYNKRVSFLISFLDEISRMGPFSMTEIMKLREQVELQTLKFEKYLIDDSKKIARNDSKHETEISKSFYLDKVRDHPNILNSNNELIEAIDLLKRTHLISEGTPLDQFRKIFQSKGLEENNLIHWTGTMIELKWLIQEICIKELCSQITGIEKWKVAQNCFSILVNGNWARIQKYTQISNASGSDKRKKQIKLFGEKLRKI